MLEEFVKAGAPEEILWINKPHIGTFRLVSMVEKMRASIIALGGEVRFGAKVEEIEIERDNNGNGQVCGVVLAGDWVMAYFRRKSSVLLPSKR